MNQKINILPLKQWGITNGRPLIIAGPCSAETEEQMLEIAHNLDKNKIHIFRAGIWKPRTRPNSFEGVGKIGLEWLKEVKKQTGLKVCTEVANVKHVYEALKAGIDILWIGARTTTNPFAVQEIADALKGVDIPILIKNPVNPDLNLWIGAIERIANAGINKVAAIHRGFSSYGNNKFRNPPHWQIAIDLKRSIPQIPLINDPSHITGNASLIFEVAQKAMDLNFDGLMIETHNNPAKAWSDAKQQITPFQLSEILNNLKLRTQKPSGNQQVETLEELRAKIDIIDDNLVEMLKNRMQIVKQIGQWKKRNNVTIYQPGRFEQIMQNADKKAVEYELDINFIENIFKTIHEASIACQTKILNSVELKKIKN